MSKVAIKLIFSIVLNNLKNMQMENGKLIKNQKEINAL